MERDEEEGEGEGEEGIETKDPPRRIKGLEKEEDIDRDDGMGPWP